jgi:uncharacterized repeat protein (TIGR04076 family)
MTPKKTDEKTKLTKKEQLKKRWKRYQELTGYTDEELKVFRSFPQNVKAMEDSPMMVKYDVMIEVTDVKNCMAGYKKGDTFRVDPFGFLIPEECPPKLCTGAIFAFKPLVSYAWQALFDGKTQLFHQSIRCPDVGVHNAGTGEITMKVYVVPRGEKLKSQKPVKVERKAKK